MSRYASGASGEAIGLGGIDAIVRSWLSGPRPVEIGSGAPHRRAAAGRATRGYAPSVRPRELVGEMPEAPERAAVAVDRRLLTVSVASPVPYGFMRRPAWFTPLSA